MLFKRIIEGKSMLNAADAKSKSPETCSRRRSECDGCTEHYTIVEEITKMILLGIVLWAGVTFGSHVAPYPLNLIVTSDIVHPPPMYDFPFPSAENLKRIPPVTVMHTNKSIDISKLEVSMLQRLESNLEAAGITPKQGSAGQGLAIHGLASKEAMHYEKSSYTITRASQNLVYTRCRRYGLPNDECASFISTLNLRESEFGGECAALERFTCRTNKMSKYRSFDGSCNNPIRSSWGQSLTGYKRLLHPRYADGIEEPRRALSLNQLPSSRLVSTKLTDNLDEPDNTRTMAFAVWGQFVYHDLVHTPVRKTIHTDKAIRCCDNSGSPLTPRYQHPSCLPIAVPSEDPHFKTHYRTCMEYTRSVTTYRGDCTFGAAEQMNQATHFLDGSHIYGSNSRVAATLRAPTGGLLKTSSFGNEEHLPLSENPTEKCLVEPTGACFNAGDVRANLHPWLTSLHSMFVREHNRVARALAALNPAWNSDKLYHEARRIVVAELQHITYKQWLYGLTGKAFDELYDSYDTGYNSDVDPSITNSFATAGFHFINTLLDQDIELRDENNVTSSERLIDHYFNPEMVTKKNGLEKVVRGMVAQNSQGMDFNYDDDLRHRWLGGLDVLAVDIQRGRDHGLPGYTQFRALCGLPPAATFQHLTDVMPQETVDKLSQLYEQPADIDLVVGMMAEKPLAGSKIGPASTCFLKEQLWRTRSGDRYFYAHSEESGSFSKRQLVELKRASLARLFCDNGGLTRTQRDVFQPPSDSNPIVPCEEIKKINLAAWQDPAQQPDILTRTNKWIKNKVTTK